MHRCWLKSISLTGLKCEDSNRSNDGCFLQSRLFDRYLVTFISTVLADELIEVTQTPSSSLDYHT